MKKPYKRLSFEERVKIELLLKEHFSPTQIAEKLARTKSTISREINKYPKNKYDAYFATANAAGLASDKHYLKSKINLNPILKKYVYNCIQRKWSPELISQILKTEYSNDKSMWLSHESIYLHIYRDAPKYIKEILIQNLPQSRTYRGNHNRGTNRKSTIKDQVRIDKRPIEVNDRVIPGHWEGDLVLGKNRESAIGTLVERTTRTLIIVPLKAKDSLSVRLAFEKAYKSIPKYMKKSLTYDNGTEMAQHIIFTENTKIPVFFANPYSPWERGTNENTNGLIRKYFPKGTDFSLITNKELKYVQNQLNERPRKVLEYKTPKNIFEKCIKNKKINKNQLSTA
jgi:transposase, IS30 family